MKKTSIFKENSFDPLDSDFGYERTSPSVSKILANTMKVLIELNIELVCERSR